MNIDQGWADAIYDYMSAQIAAGYPATTQYTRRQHLEHLARRIGVPPWEVTSDQLIEFAADQEWKPETRRSRRTTFQSFWSWAMLTGRTSSNPAIALTRVKLPRPAPRPVPERIYLQAYAKATDLERVWMQLAYDHGLRRGEIAQVHARDVLESWATDEAGNRIRAYSLVVHGKGAVERTVPLVPRTALGVLDHAQGGWLTPGDHDGHVSARWLGKRVNRLLPDGWTIHTLRHGAGTKFNLHGGLLVAQRMLGHASVATTQVYCAMPDESLRDTVYATAA